MSADVSKSAKPTLSADEKIDLLRHELSRLRDVVCPQDAESIDAVLEATRENQ